jgi:ATP-dependent RNA helicase RhlE
MAIHGNKSQSARTKALAEFKDGSLTALVATDIAARGIDIDQLPHVVNYDLPNVPEDYVHRIGRTGRAGATGEAVSLVCVDEHQMLRDIEKLIRQTLPRHVIPGFEPDPNAKAQPIQLRSGDRGNGNGNRGRGGNGNRGGKPAAPHATAHTAAHPAGHGGNKPRSPSAPALLGGQRPGGQPGNRGGQPGNRNGGRPQGRGPRPAAAQRSGGGEG